MRQKDFFEFKRFTICQQHAAMKVGTDSDLLGTLAAGGLRILDIGTGTGIIALMMAQRFPEAKITAVEIDDQAVMDAKLNFEQSPFSDRIELIHSSFQDYLASNPAAEFDCVVCNPPYFDKSTECPDLGRTRARHTSSLPFSVLVSGAYNLLKDEGVFSVCIPPEVLDDFTTECLLKGFWLQDNYQVKSMPHKPAKRYVLVHKKGKCVSPRAYTYCMRNADSSRSDWYKEQLKDFHLG